MRIYLCNVIQIIEKLKFVSETFNSFDDRYQTFTFKMSNVYHINQPQNMDNLKLMMVYDSQKDTYGFLLTDNGVFNIADIKNIEPKIGHEPNHKTEPYTVIDTNYIENVLVELMYEKFGLYHDTIIFGNEQKVKEFDTFSDIRKLNVKTQNGIITIGNKENSIYIKYNLNDFVFVESKVPTSIAHGLSSYIDEILKISKQEHETRSFHRKAIIEKITEIVNHFYGMIHSNSYIDDLFRKAIDEKFNDLNIVNNIITTIKPKSIEFKIVFLTQYTNRPLKININFGKNGTLSYGDDHLNTFSFGENETIEKTIESFVERVALASVIIHIKRFGFIGLHERLNAFITKENRSVYIMHEPTHTKLTNTKTNKSIVLFLVDSEILVIENGLPLQFSNIGDLQRYLMEFYLDEVKPIINEVSVQECVQESTTLDDTIKNGIQDNRIESISSTFVETGQKYFHTRDKETMELAHYVSRISQTIIDNFGDNVFNVVRQGEKTKIDIVVNKKVRATIRLNTLYKTIKLSINNGIYKKYNFTVENLEMIFKYLINIKKHTIDIKIVGNKINNFTDITRLFGGSMKQKGHSDIVGTIYRKKVTIHSGVAYIYFPLFMLTFGIKMDGNYEKRYVTKPYQMNNGFDDNYETVMTNDLFKVNSDKINDNTNISSCINVEIFNIIDELVMGIETVRNSFKKDYTPIYTNAIKRLSILHHHANGLNDMRSIDLVINEINSVFKG